MRRVLILMIWLLPVAALAAPIPPGDALPNGGPTTLADLRIFEQTGLTMRGELSAFWGANGGLALFGLPIDAEQRGPAVMTHQWTERSRLEYALFNPADYQVQLGLLGKELLERQGRDWRNEGNGVALDGPCRTFAATERSVCGPFLRYWQSHGLDFGQPGISDAESTALFGLPLTAAQMERNSAGDRVLTQWFERARFEYHPDNPTAYQVLLGRLGAELHGEPPAPAILKLAQPSAVIQGQPWAFSLPDQQFDQVAGLLGAWPISFARTTTNDWLGIGSVDALEPVGPIKLQIVAQRADGATWYGQTTMDVLEGEYAAERVILPPSVNDSIANNPAKVEAERIAVNAIWPQITTTKLWRGPFMLPAQGIIASSFGTRRAYNDGPFNSYHEGVDIANGLGTPVVASNSGRVVFAQDDLIVHGGAVIIDHGWGIHTGYWHMDKVLAQVGDLVQQGDQIGLMGTKGYSTAPHVHWDLRIGALPTDAMAWTIQDWGAALP